MSESSTTESAAAERRVYHAQLMTCLAVVPTFMGLAGLITAASFGNRDLRGLLFAHPLVFVIALTMAMLFVLAWWLLGRRHPGGAILALTLFAWMLISTLNRSNLSYLGIAFAVVGLIVAARAWPAMQRSPRPAP